MSNRRVLVLTALGLVLLGLLVSTQVTIFVVQPIGAVPEGRTLIISRLENLKFVDSADAFSERTVGSVSLLTRGLALSRVLEKATIYARLPYSRSLYLMSTGGKEYASPQGQ